MFQAKIITKLLDVNPKHRPSASQILLYLDEMKRLDRPNEDNDKDVIIDQLKMELKRKKEEIEQLQSTIRQMEMDHRWLTIRGVGYWTGWKQTVYTELVIMSIL